MLLTGDGIQGDGTLEGNEEALTTYTDDVIVNQLRHAVRSAGKMSEQRIPFSVREEARLGLQDWWADRIDASFFNQISGNLNAGASAGVLNVSTKKTGNNDVTAPDSEHQIIANGEASEASAGSTSTATQFNLSLLDQAVETAKTLTPQIRPIRVNGSDKFVCFLHPYQVTSMRTTTSTGQWLDIQKSLLTGTGSRNSPIFSGALGEYNGVILHESTRVPVGSDSSGTAQSNVRRACFVGAQAACMSFGRGYGTNKMSWVEELFDYKNQLGVSAGMIYGVKKSIFNGSDFASMVISTRAVANE